MKKLLLLTAGILALSTSAIAQFRFQDHTGIGQDYTIDSIGNTPTGTYSFYVHFNTDKNVSTYSETAVSFAKCQTQRGIQVKVYPDSTSTTAVVANDFKCDNYGSNGNPTYVANTDSLINIMKKFTALNVATADSARNYYWKPAACLFDVVNGDTANQAFGCYPGKYKRVEYGFQFNMTGFAPTSDLSFTMDTYDPGNTGKTAAYKLIVFIGSVSAANAVDTIENFYITGSGKKVVKLAYELGIDSLRFNDKVYIHLTTMGTDTAQIEGMYDPIIIFDDFRISWGAPEWVSPAVSSGTIYNENGAGTYSPYTVDATTNVATVQVYLKDKSRVSSMTIINDVEFPPSKYQFLDSLGVFANDGSGNYNVPVSYKLTKSELNSETGNYSDSYITIPAPDSKTDDDIMVLMTFTPKSTAFTERIEVNNGVRFWWDVQTKGYNPPAWVSPAVTSGTIYNESGAGNYSPYTVQGDTGTVQVYLKDQYRTSTIKIINDVDVPPSKYQFLDSLGVFANDGSGNYTVPVTYTFTPSELDTVSNTYSQSYITIPAPASTATDDIMVLMTFIPTVSDFTERLEITNGVLFWWDVQTAALIDGVEKIDVNGLSVYVSHSTVFVQGAIGSVSLYNIMGQKMGTFTSDEAAKGITIQKGIAIITTSKGAAKVLIP